MRIHELFQASEPAFSFEFFPPAGERGREDLLATIAELKPLRPGFVSVTYGAGGSTQDRTVELVSHIKNRMGLEAMAHLTCAGSSRAELRAVLDRLESEGIEDVIALRGDPPAGTTDFVPHPNGPAHASDLVAMIVEERRPFCVAVACYPEVHKEAASPRTDLKFLALKLAAGASFAITQLFFDNRFYFDFVQRATKAGIHAPIVAGIMPITNVTQIVRFTKMCGASIPEKLWAQLEVHREDSDAVARIGIEHASRQCSELLAAGVPGIHFYTLNRSRSTCDILTNIRTNAGSGGESSST